MEKTAITEAMRERIITDHVKSFDDIPKGFTDINHVTGELDRGFNDLMNLLALAQQIKDEFKVDVDIQDVGKKTPRDYIAGLYVVGTSNSEHTYLNYTEAKACLYGIQMGLEAADIKRRGR